MKRKSVLLLMALIVAGALGILAAAAASATNKPASMLLTATTINNKEIEDCGCENDPMPDVLGVVNGVEITTKDLSEDVGRRIGELQNQIVEARSNELDKQINTKLLEAEARTQGVSASALVEREVLSRVAPPTEADARAFYEQNKDRIEGEFKDVRDDLLNHLRGQQQRAAAKSLAKHLRSAAKIKIVVQTVTPAATSADRARVFALVNSEPITSGNVEDQLQPLILDVQEGIYAVYRRGLEDKINDVLVQQEAQGRNITAQLLFDSEVVSRAAKVYESDARAFYVQNKNQINGEYEQIKPQLLRYLQTQAEENAKRAFLERLRRAATIQLFLRPPEQPTYPIAIDDQPLKGNPSAPVTIIEFTDYQCPACAQAQPILESITLEYGDRVKLVVRDYPLKRHANAFKAAEAAEAAREQGRYWQYIAILFSNQSQLGINELQAYATRLGLDRTRFDAALDSGRFAVKVERDLQDGNRLGINGTPSLFVNGRRLSDLSYESLKTAIDAALKDRQKTQR